MFLKINNYLKILCFFNLVSCSFIGKNNLILAAELPRQISLNEENSQKQILIKTPLENISQPKYFGDENFGDEKLPTSTYYYILDLYGDGKTTYKGYVFLKR